MSKNKYTSPSETAVIQLSRFTAVKPERLTKQISLAGGILKQEKGGVFVKGEVETITLTGLAAIAAMMDALEPTQALAYGICDHDKAAVVTRKVLESGKAGRNKALPAISRTNDKFHWSSGCGLMMIDYDPSKTGDALSKDDLIQHVSEAIDDSECGLIWRPSSSSHVINADTGEDLTGLRGQRIYIPVKDASDIKRASAVLCDVLWLLGHGHYEVSKSGCVERGLIDGSVYQPERLDFAAGAKCEAPLVQNADKTEVFEGGVLDTREMLPDLTAEELKELAEIKAKAKAAAQLEPEAKAPAIKPKDEKTAPAAFTFKPLTTAEAEAFKRQRTGSHENIISKFNDAHDIEDICEENGFTFGSRGDEVSHWTPPMSESGSAGFAVWSKDGSEWWTCFNESVKSSGMGAESDSGVQYGDAFDLFTHFKHEGDIKAAVHAAAELVDAEGQRKRQEEWRAKKYSDITDNYIFNRDTDCYVERKTGQQITGSTLNKIFMSKGYLGLKTTKPKAVNAFHLGGGIEVHGVCNKPQPVCDMDFKPLPIQEFHETKDGVFWNEYKGFEIEPKAGMDISPWIENEKYQYGELTEVVLDYKAFLVQHPDKKIRWGILAYGGARTGKGLSVKPLEWILGNQMGTVKNINARTGWGDFTYGKRLLVYNEISQGRAPTFWNNFKDSLTDDGVVSYNMKGGEIKTARDLSGHIMFTNEKNALNFNPHENKLLCVKTPAYPKYGVLPSGEPTEKSKENFRAIAAVADTKEGAQAVLAYLLQRDLSNFNSEQLFAPADTARYDRELALNGLTESWGDKIDGESAAEVLCSALLLNSENPDASPFTGRCVIDSDDLMGELECAGIYMGGIQTSRLGKVMKTAGWTSRRCYRTVEYRTEARTLYINPYLGEEMVALLRGMADTKLLELHDEERAKQAGETLAKLVESATKMGVTKH